MMKNDALSFAASAVNEIGMYGEGSRQQSLAINVFFEYIELMFFYQDGNIWPLHLATISVVRPSTALRGAEFQR